MRRSRANPLIAIKNESKNVLTDYQIMRMIPSLQRQITEHFHPAWGISAQIMFAERAIPKDAYQIIIYDRPSSKDDEGYLGYHFSPEGYPIASIFALDDMSEDGTISDTLSHEILEMLVDPGCNLYAHRPARGTRPGRGYFYEICLTGDTKIPLLSGEEAEIKDLVGRDEFWVYSSTPEGKIRPGRGHSARQTGKGRRIVRVLLDNGESVTCTPDHKFLMRDGAYKRAGELKPGESLMPLYRRLMPVRESGNEYEQVFVPALEDWRFTHRVVEARCPKGYVRHHKDHNRLNNAPTNIEIMEWDAHRKHHADHIREVGRAWSEKAVAAGIHPFQVYTQTEQHRESSRRRIVEYNKSEAHRNAAAEIGRRNMSKLWEGSEFREHHRKRGAILATRYNTGEAQRRLMREDPEWAAKKLDSLKRASHASHHKNRGIVKEGCKFCAEPVNHKVVAVTLEGSADVYDISVDGYHNFAVSSGVFVHNCDPVQCHKYEIDGILVVDFVYPEWYEYIWKPKSRKFDHLDLVKKPFEVLPKCYADIYERSRRGFDTIWGSTTGTHKKRHRRKTRRKAGDHK